MTACAERSPRNFAPAGQGHELALEAVEVLGKGGGVGGEVVVFECEEGEGVEFVEGVEEAEEVARVAVGSEGEEVAESWREEGGELGFGEEFLGGY